MDCGAVAFRAFFRSSTIRKKLTAHQAPSAILTGLLEDSNSKLAIALMRLSDKASAMLSDRDGEGPTYVKCRFVPPRPNIL